MRSHACDASLSIVGLDGFLIDMEITITVVKRFAVQSFRIGTVIKIKVDPRNSDNLCGRNLSPFLTADAPVWSFKTNNTSVRFGFATPTTVPPTHGNDEIGVCVIAQEIEKLQPGRFGDRKGRD